ncbi:hypothetical protein [Erwinia sorbitola]|uniref:Type VI secretion system tip protein VgrG n=1 Tax=Erwinia sorbitola TaxID=2681984 RepID=A0ABW9RFV5_9GAMM|nr:hypothetical protein [Erwinia sorbitola]MTD29080.1 hypothetical protein [Erwinia sorbitola]
MFSDNSNNPAAFAGRSPGGLQFTLTPAGLSPDALAVIHFTLKERFSTPFQLNVSLAGAELLSIEHTGRQPQAPEQASGRQGTVPGREPEQSLEWRKLTGAGHE